MSVEVVGKEGWLKLVAIASEWQPRVVVEALVTSTPNAACLVWWSLSLE